MARWRGVLNAIEAVVIVSFEREVSAVAIVVRNLSSIVILTMYDLMY